MGDMIVFGEIGSTGPLHSLKRKNADKYNILNVQKDANYGFDHQAYGLQRRTRSRTSSASLHYHIIYEDVDLLRSTVQQDGCDLETKNDIGDTALIAASRLESAAGLEMMKILLDNNCDVNARNSDGDTALHISSKSLKLAHVELLVQYQANVNAVNLSGKVPLFMCLRPINTHQIEKSWFLHTPVPFYKAQAEKIKDFLLQNDKIDVNAGDLMFNPFHEVCTNCFFTVDCVREFLNKGANIHLPGTLNRYPIHMIVSVARLDKLKMFVDAGATLDVVDSNGNTPLHEAILPGKSRFTRRIDERILIAKYLIDEGASTSAQNNVGDSPLHIACKHMFLSKTHCPDDVGISVQHIETARFIVKHSQDSLSIKNHEGKTPFEVMGEILLNTKHIWWGGGNFEIDNELMTSAKLAIIHDGVKDQDDDADDDY